MPWRGKCSPGPGGRRAAGRVLPGRTRGWCPNPGESLCTVPRSHATGGAVDVTLSWHGVPLALGTDYPSTDDAALLTAFERTDGPVRELRRLLAKHLFAQGMVPDPAVWWHWSYGDARWAAHMKTMPRYDETLEGGHHHG